MKKYIVGFVIGLFFERAATIYLENHPEYN